MISSEERKETILSASLAAIAAGALIFSFWPSLLFLAGRWQSEEYSHGILIPLLALLLGWHALTEKKPVRKPCWQGMELLLGGCALLFVSQNAAFELAGAYGLWLSIAGLFLSFMGKEAFRATMPALIYLLFAIPLPRGIEADLSQKLQLLSSDGGVGILDLLGISVFQDGNIIDLGTYRLQVVDACSGLRYLFPLMSFGFLIALLLKDQFWKRAVLFLSSIPIAIFMNTLRIAFVGITVERWGSEAAEGFLHFFEGWVVFLICVLILLAQTALLMRLPPRGHFCHERIGLAKGALFSGFIPNPNTMRSIVFLALFLALMTGTGMMTRNQISVPPLHTLDSFPLRLDTWEGRTEPMEGDVLKALGLTDYWLADYTKPDGAAPVTFYIAYYAAQGAGVTTHSPSLCLPGGGWHIEKSWREKINPMTGVVFDASRLLLRKDDTSLLVTYWFEERGRHMTSTYEAKAYLLLDSLRTGRTDGALVRLSTPIMAGETLQEAARRSDDFLDLAYPWIGHFVPSKTK